MSLYLIRRQPRPDYHKAPYHRVIVCALKRIARWEVGWTGDRSWLWTKQNEPFTGWLLERWEGLDIDYGHIVRGGKLPDGTDMAFHHPHGSNSGTWDLLRGAVWYSDKPIPTWLVERGVVYPPDDFTQGQLLDLIADDGVMGFSNRKRPACWPAPITWQEWNALAGDVA